jgi:hypothetical protein
MAPTIKQPRIEYTQLQGEFSEARVCEAFFLLFEEMVRTGKMKDIRSMEKKGRDLSTERANGISTTRYN